MGVGGCGSRVGDGSGGWGQSAAELVGVYRTQLVGRDDSAGVRVTGGRGERVCNVCYGIEVGVIIYRGQGDRFPERSIAPGYG